MNGNEGLTGQEACPKYCVEHLKAQNGRKATVHIAVALPGVTDSSNIRLVVQERQCTVAVAGRYHVQIPLIQPVESTAEVVRFVRKKAVLECVLRIQESYLQHDEQVPQQGLHSTQDKSATAADNTAGNAGEQAVPAQQPTADRCANERAAPATPSPLQSHKQQQRATEHQQKPGQTDLFEQAKLHAKRDAAEDCGRLARKLEQTGDLQRATRLWRKACQLMPDNDQYQQAFAAASRKLAALGEANRSFSSAGGHAVPPVACSGDKGSGSASTAPDGSSSAARPQPEGAGVQQAGRQGIGLGGTVRLLLGLAMVITAAYCLCTTASPWPGTLPNHVTIAGLVESDSASSTAVAAAVMHVTPSESVGSTYNSTAGGSGLPEWRAHSQYPESDPLMGTQPSGQPQSSGSYKGSTAAAARGREASFSAAKAIVHGPAQSSSLDTAGTPVQQWVSKARARTKVKPGKHRSSSSSSTSSTVLHMPEWLCQTDAALCFCAKEVFWAVVFLPRVLLRDPRCQGVASCALAAAGTDPALLPVICFAAVIMVGMKYAQPCLSGRGSGKGGGDEAGTSRGRGSSTFGSGRKKPSQESTAMTPSHLKVREVPGGAPPAVAKVLQSGNYYDVLGVPRDSEDADIRRARRTMSLATHPDKIGDQPGANDAFNLVVELEFQERLVNEKGLGGGGFRGTFGAASACAAGDTMDDGERMQQQARYCRECADYHAVEEGETWIERSKAG
ncbi:hypothetical protein N2152v2_004019 [Parachlorella kessleri]